jgi:UDP-N-acetylmuramate-alanine ligase
VQLKAAHSRAGHSSTHTLKQQVLVTSTLFRKFNRCVVDAYSQHRPLSMQSYRAFLKEHARRGCQVEAGVDLEEHKTANLAVLNALLALTGECGC